MKRYLAFFWMMAAAAIAGDQIPVYGPARAGVEDWDLLMTTVLDVGEVAYDPSMPSELRVGDGITPGGIVVRQDGTVTNFSQVSTATTNLTMRHFAIEWGAWRVAGGTRALNLTWGADEMWLRFVRDSGQAYLSYNFAVLSAGVYRFVVANAEGEPTPVLQVSTNLLEGYAAAVEGTYGIERVNAGRIAITYTNDPVSSCFFARVFDASGLKSGAYFAVPIHATTGIVDAAGAAITNWGDLTNSLSARINDVAAGVDANAGNIATHTSAIAENAGNIYSNASALTSITNALGRRISEFEEINLLVSREMSTSGENVWEAPTEIPTRYLNLHIMATNFTSTNFPLTVRIPSTLQPARPTTIRMLLVGITSATRLNYELGTTRRMTNYNPSQSQRQIEFHWLPEVGAWQYVHIQLQASHSLYTRNGASTPASAWSLPTTIENWIAWRNQQTW